MVYVFLLFLKTEKITFTYYLKIALYFTLFLKFIFRKQQPNSIINFYLILIILDYFS